MAATDRHPAWIRRYNKKVKTHAAAATGTVDRNYRKNIINADGTDAWVMGRPLFRDQYITVEVGKDSANTPIVNLTVTGMRESTQNVWTLTGYVAASAPRGVTFHSPDGLVWDAIGVVSCGSAVGVVVA